jgi:outer membrane lipoprotein carrier protein
MLLIVWSGITFSSPQQEPYSKNTARTDSTAVSEFINLTTKTTDYQAQFEQKVKDQFGSVKDQSHGILLLKKPFKFAWHTKTPYEQKVISDGSTLWTFDIDLDQVNIQDVNKAAGSTPVFILQADAAELTQSFHVSLLNSGDSTAQTFELIPKENSEAFERLMIMFKDSMMVELLMFDSLGQQTVVNFKQGKLNQGIAEQEFSLTIPEDVDVIDSRQR